MPKFTDPLSDKHIRERRLKLRMSQLELAQQLGCSLSTIQRYEASQTDALPKRVSLALEGLEQRRATIPLGSQARLPMPAPGRPGSKPVLGPGDFAIHLFAEDGTPVANDNFGRLEYVGETVWQMRTADRGWRYIRLRTERANGYIELPFPAEIPAWLLKLSENEGWRKPGEPARPYYETDSDIVTT